MDKNKAPLAARQPKPSRTRSASTASPSADPRHAHALFEILREIKELREEVASLRDSFQKHRAALRSDSIRADMQLVLKATRVIVRNQTATREDESITKAIKKDFFNDR